MKVKEDSEKIGVKLNIGKTKIMASGPITSWQMDEETVETVADFILGDVMLNGLPWKQTEIILSFFRLHARTAFQTLLLTMKTTPLLLRDSCPQ